MQKLLVVVPALLSACVAPTVRMSSDPVVPIAQGSITGGTSALGGQASFEELGVEDVDRVGAAPRIEIRGMAGTLSLGYMPGSYAGDGMLDADLQIGGEIFSQSTGVHTEMGADFLTARWTATVVDTDPVTLGLGVGLCGLDLEMRVEELDGSGVGEFDELIPLPMGVVRIEGDLGDFGFEASYGFFDAAVGDGERRLRDLDTRLCMGIENTNAVLVIGYRSVRVDGTHDGGADSTVIDVAFGGPYLGLSFGF